VSRLHEDLFGIDERPAALALPAHRIASREADAQGPS
jgi:hypothetical protein